MTTSYVPPLRTLGAIACALCGTASAQQATGYVYGGISAGQANSQFDEARIVDSLLPLPFSRLTLSDDTRGKAFKVFGGYQFNRNVALEAGYFNLGRFGLSSTTTPAGSLDGRFKVRGYNLDLVGTVPLLDNLSALLRIGAQHSTTKSDFSGSGAPGPVSGARQDGTTGAKYGAGLQYAFGPSLLLRGEVERYRVADPVGGHANINVASLSLVFTFGRAPASRPVAAYVPPPPAPVVFAPAPAPAPMVVVAPPPAPEVVVMSAPAAPAPAAPMPARVSYSAESLFGFDESALRPEGKAALDAFSRDLAGSQYDRVSVEGHTDRIGTTAYNQKLSEQRAEVVKSYLVAGGRIDAGKVSAMGKGEMVPVTRAEDCKGTSPTTQLKACLQPDRRVDIEVVGTR
ncbi:MAG: OmpA family protein [Aquabacterium sp.]